MALTTVKSDQIQTSVALAGSPTTTTQSASDNSTKIATTAYVETAVANLVASAPAALNTLDELAAALNDDASFSTTITNSIATKLPLAGGTMTGDLILGDNIKLEVGSASGGDLQLYHDGSNSYIAEAGTGDLIITATVLRPRTDDFVVNNAANSQNMITATAGGAATLYHGGSPKIATTSTGISVTGTLNGITTTQSVSGNRWGVLPEVASNGVLEIGRYLDFHATDGDTSDYGARFDYDGSKMILTSAMQIEGATTLNQNVTVNGNVGIGTSPSAFLHLETGTTTDILRFGAGGRWGFQRANSDSRYVSFSRAMNGTAQAVFTVDGDNGNVGIGLSSGISSKLHVNNQIVLGPDASNYGIVNYGSNSDVLTFGTKQSGTNYFNTVSITDGQVGIGNTSPLQAHTQGITIGPRTILSDVVSYQTLLANNAYYKTGSVWKSIVATGGGYSAIRMYNGAFRVHTGTVSAADETLSNMDGTDIRLSVGSDGKVGVGLNPPYAQFGVYRNQTDTYTANSFLDQPTMEVKHPSTNGGYNGIRYTNTSGNYEWFAGTNQNASAAADFVFQGYDRGNTTYREMARIHDSGSITAPNQVGFRALGTRAAWIQGATTIWNLLTSANTGNASGGVFPVGLSVGADNHQNQYNVGSCFNVSNGRFTVPIEGKYQVYGSAYCGKTTTAATSYMHFLVYVNGQQINEIYTIGGNGHPFTHDFHLNFSTVLFLEVNDYVDWRMYTYDANVKVYGDHLSIGAHLLS